MAETLSGTQKSAKISEAPALRQQPGAWQHLVLVGGAINDYRIPNQNNSIGAVSERERA